jgi:hypothetical protein
MVAFYDGNRITKLPEKSDSIDGNISASASSQIPVKSNGLQLGTVRDM